MLRGTGWKGGAPVTGKGRKHVEPWIPAARPAQLGIGAKGQDMFNDGSGKGEKQTAVKVRPEKRYVLLVKKEREGSSALGRDSRRQSPPSRRESAPTSRRGSRSPSPRRRHGDRDRDDRRRDYGNGREKKDRDSRAHDRRDYDRDQNRHRDRSPPFQFQLRVNPSMFVYPHRDY